MSLAAERAVAHVAFVGDPGTVKDVLDLRAARSPDDLFVRFCGEGITFAEALVRAERAAGALKSLGIGKGDRIALMLPNCLEFLDLWFGCALIGAVFVPVNLALRGEGLRYILEHSDAHALFADETVTEAVDAALPAAVRPIVRFAMGGADGWLSAREFLDGGSRHVARAALGGGDLASILYTSGTTGLPKGVMNCHNAYVAAGCEFTQRFVGIRSDDVLYTSLPLFHVNAQMLTTVGSLVSGRPMVLAPRFSASRFFDDIRAEGATVFNYIGAMLTMLFKQGERADDASNPARLAIGGAAPAEIWCEFERRFGTRILEIYGLTETATFCVGSPPDDIRAGKIGQPVSWSEVRILRDDGGEAAAGERGEIVIRSKRPDILFKGYYKDEAATESAFRNGWFRSGDRGYRDTDDYLVFVDRLKDCIRRRGENISSYEVERVMNNHPAVAESAAIGVPSELGEEDVMVAVVVNPGADVEPEALVEYCLARMAAFMVPRYIRFMPELPKTATQRVQKFLLRDEGVALAWDRESAVAQQQ